MLDGLHNATSQMLDTTFIVSPSLFLPVYIVYAVISVLLIPCVYAILPHYKSSDSHMQKVFHATPQNLGLRICNIDLEKDYYNIDIMQVKSLLLFLDPGYSTGGSRSESGPFEGRN